MEVQDFIRPYSSRFGEHYWLGGAGEKAFVFLDGNNLAARFGDADNFALGELGFGTGLTFLLAAELWGRVAPEGARLTYISYEKFPFDGASLREIFKGFPVELQEAAARLLEVYEVREGWNQLEMGCVTLKLFVGDVREGLAEQVDVVDAWFLDGFSPTINPEMWDEAVLTRVGMLTKRGGTASTYSVAALVRARMEAAGFKIGKAPGFPPKRRMLKAVKL